ncbi:YIP1 family protein [Gaoshiqia sp. Z1-71]|uniref:YIP1 family protein n=1 Tax=Gaoshiqia hydrogeniformans TaxID=3290090 RepID=UPI003BF851C2
MDFKQQYNWIYQECKSILADPKKFWDKKQPDYFTENIVVRLLLPLIVITGAAVFLGELISKPDYLLSFALMKAIRIIVSYLIQYYLAVAVISALQVNYGGLHDRQFLSYVIAFTLLPFVIASFITGLFHGLALLNIVGLYGFYIFVTGAQTSLGIPEVNRSRFIMLSILLILLIFGMTNIVSWKLLSVIFPYGA